MVNHYLYKIVINNILMFRLFMSLTRFNFFAVLIFLSLNTSQAFAMDIKKWCPCCLESHGFEDFEEIVVGDTTYFGQHVNGIPHGCGKREKSQGLYKGQFQEGIFHGFGHLEFNVDEKVVYSFTGWWAHGQKLRGAEHKSDGYYEGEFYDDNYGGIGTFIGNCRCMWKGMWKNGELLELTYFSKASSCEEHKF